MSDIQPDIVQEILESLSHIGDEIPQVIQSFSSLSKAALQSGQFDRRTKEVIALAIAIATYSKGCMKFHLESLVKQHLSHEELLEIVAIVTYMCGGSGLIASTKALKYFEQMQPSSNSTEIEKNTGDKNAKVENGNKPSFRDQAIKGYD